MLTVLLYALAAILYGFGIGLTYVGAREAVVSCLPEDLAFHAGDSNNDPSVMWRCPCCENHNWIMAHKLPLGFVLRVKNHDVARRLDDRRAR